MSDHLFVYIGIFFFFLLVALIPSYASLREIVRILRTPSSTISSVPYEGQVEVTGRALHYITRSLLTRSPCALWQVRILKTNLPSESPESPVLFQEISEQVFEIGDGTGSIRVDPMGAELVLHDHFIDTSNLMHPLDRHTRRLVREIGVQTTNAFGADKFMEVHEHIVDTSKTIYVLGHVDFVDGKATIVSRPGSPVVISDRSQRELLGTLIRRVAANMFIILLMAALLIFCSSAR